MSCSVGMRTRVPMRGLLSTRPSDFQALHGFCDRQEAHVKPVSQLPPRQHIANRQVTSQNFVAYLLVCPSGQRLTRMSEPVRY